MSISTIVRAWKDEEYRRSLSDEQQAQLPEHPAGLLELTEQELEHIAGGRRRRRRRRRRSSSNSNSRSRSNS